MSKVKQWAEDTAEKSVVKIILNYKKNLITKETAIIRLPFQAVFLLFAYWFTKK